MRHRANHPAAAAVFDPATLALQGWWRIANGGEYNGSPWAGTASAGGSNGFSLSEATNPPAVGVNLNGAPTADFDGTNDQLTQASALSNFVSAGAWSVIALVSFDAVGGGGAGQGEVFSDSGQYLTIGTLNSSGNKVRASAFDSGQKSIDATLPNLSAFCCIQAKGDGSTLKLRVDSGTWQSTACGNLGALTGTLRVGSCTPFFLNGQLAELMLAQTNFADATMDQIKSYFNARYALAL